MLGCYLLLLLILLPRVMRTFINESQQNKKQLKKRRGNMGGTNAHISDRISDLPNHILITILDLLPAKSAVQTSILSSRWRYLWTFISNLILDIDLEHDEEYDTYESKLIAFVNGFFKFHKEQSVKRISFRFYTTDHIDEWIELAMAKRVEELQLDFIKTDYSLVDWFPFGFLKLSPCTAFTYLKVLCLQHVKVSEVMLLCLISSLQVIESIKLVECTALKELTILSPPQSLKSLTVKDCYPVRNVEICAPNLQSFEFMVFYPVYFLHMCLPSLRDATLVFYSKMSNLDADEDDDVDDEASWNDWHEEVVDGVINLMHNITHVSSLKVSDAFIGYMIEGARLHHPFIYLEELQLSICERDPTLFYLIDEFLPGCPNLMKLTIDPTVNNSRVQMFMNCCGIAFPRLEEDCLNAWVTPHCMVHNLKKIEIKEFKGCNDEVELVKFLLMKSEVLESMMITACSEYDDTSEGANLRQQESSFRICQQLLALPRESSDAKIFFSPYF